VTTANVVPSPNSNWVRPSLFPFAYHFGFNLLSQTTRKQIPADNNNVPAGTKSKLITLTKPNPGTRVFLQGFYFSPKPPENISRQTIITSLQGQKANVLP
jgi:hypothetical protein